MGRTALQYDFLQGEIMAPTVPPPQENTVWAVKPAEKAKYDAIFEVRQLTDNDNDVLCSAFSCLPYRAIF